MDETGVSVYHGRALQLANAMKLCRDDLRAYASAAALLAVHSAISYNDAVLLMLEGRRARTKDHGVAIEAVKRACAKARIKQEGIQHLTRLLSAKNDVSYGEKRVDDQRVEALCAAAERFQTWAERLLGKIV